MFYVYVIFCCFGVHRVSCRFDSLPSETILNKLISLLLCCKASAELMSIMNSHAGGNKIASEIFNFAELCERGWALTASDWFLVVHHVSIVTYSM